MRPRIEQRVQDVVVPERRVVQAQPVRVDRLAGRPARKSRCRAAARRSARRPPRILVAGRDAYSCRPSAGISDSWKEERRPPASGRSSSRRRATASRRVACQSRDTGVVGHPEPCEATASALPSSEAWTRGRPSMALIEEPVAVTGEPRRGRGSRRTMTRSSAAASSSTTRRPAACAAPSHLLYGCTRSLIQAVEQRAETWDRRRAGVLDRLAEEVAASEAPDGRLGPSRAAIPRPRAVKSDAPTCRSVTRSSPRSAPCPPIVEFVPPRRTNPSLGPMWWSPASPQSSGACCRSMNCACAD